MNNFYRFLLLTLLILLCCMTSGLVAAEYWVAKDGNDLDGTGAQGNPFLTITRALEEVSSDSYDTITVRAGTYTENVTFPYFGMLLRSESGAESTIIDFLGSSEYTGIFMSSNTLTAQVIDGFTITGCYTSAIYVYGYGEGTPPTVEIRNCRITNSGRAIEQEGGAIWMQFAIASIHDNYFEGNSASNAGGAIYSYYCDLKVWNNEFYSNLVSGAESYGGGGMYVQGNGGGDPIIIKNNLFIENRASSYDGGGAYIAESKVYLLNNLFLQNVAAHGGGVFMRDGTAPTLLNNSFVLNSQFALDCDGNTSPGEIAFNAFYINTPDNEPLQGCFLAANDGNIYDHNPLFVNPDSGDYHLMKGSPLIDSGSADYPVEDDINYDYDHGPRIIYAAPDIGPFEWVDCDLTPEFTVTPDSACTSSVIAFTNTSNSWPEKVVWDFGNGTGDTLLFPDHMTVENVLFDSAGTYNVTLTMITSCDTATVSHEAVILDGPQATFLAETGGATCAPLTVTFVNETIADENSYFWDFGDGDTSSVTHPQHEYLMAGSYEVSLMVTNGCGTSTAYDTIVVADFPTAGYTTNVTFGAAPLTVQFTDTSLYAPSNWSWDFGDGGTSTEQNPLHVYQTPGIYSVTLEVGNDCGDAEPLTVTDQITVTGYTLTALDSDTTDRFNQTFRVLVDTLFGPFGGSVELNTKFTENPRRGTVSFSLSDDSVNVPDTVTVTAQLGRTLAQDQYHFSVIGSLVGGVEADTVGFAFRSWPDSLVRLLSDLVDFDSVQIDSVRVDTLTIRNIGPFVPPLDELTLSVLNAHSSNTHFKVLNPTSTSPLPTNGGVYYLMIEFAPTELGQVTGTLDIQTDDPVAPFLSVDMMGVGISERNPPEIASQTPLPDERGVLIRAPIQIELSEEIDSSTVTGSSLTVMSARLHGAIPGTVTLEDGNLVTFVPDDMYPPLDTLTVTLSALITDLVGNGLDGNLDGVGSLTAADNAVFKFTTGIAVFPGDCNNDGIVNEIDVLPIGIHFGATGFARDVFGEGEDNILQEAVAWDDTAATYADANGDGVVDERDVGVLHSTWNFTHDWPSNMLAPNVNYNDYAVNFSELRDEVEAIANSEAGTQMLQVINTVASDAILPDRVMLLQNYPNPFNPMTRIDYALPEPAEVRLTVHNILGQTVRTLVDNYEGAGFKNVIWDGADESGVQVSSGVYFYKLEVGTQLEIRKMLKLQ